MRNKTINILCATDDNYVPYCGIMLTSLFENNPQYPICVYILIDHYLSERNVAKFKKLAKKYHQQITYVLVDKSYLEKFPIKGQTYWSIATYYRLYAEELLPKSVDKVLYLDCDIIVTGSLASLLDIDMKGMAIGTVPDIFCNSLEIYERLDYSPKDSYFNAGSVLLNLEYWREHNIKQRCLEYLNTHYDRIYANDQDVLNAVLHDKNIQLPITYNYQIQFLKRNFFEQYSQSFQKEVLDIKRPIIIHYAAPRKPWNCLYYKKPFKREWLHYKWRSQWWYLLPQMPPKKKLNYLIKRYLLWPFGIMWNQDYISY